VVFNEKLRMVMMIVTEDEDGS